MNFVERLHAIRAGMEREGIDRLVALHDGSHFGGGSNPFMVLTGLRSMGDAAAVLERDGTGEVIVSPAWDAERFAQGPGALRVRGVDDMATALGAALAGRAGSTAVAGLGQMPWKTAARVRSALGGAGKEARNADALLETAARRKTDEEIAAARKATAIAEKGYERMLELTRPGIREDELAVELRWYMKTLGAEDNFFMLNAGPKNRSVAPCSGRALEPGDFVLTELSPIYAGQMTQICRTIFLGRASEEQRASYALLSRGFEAGLAAAGPGKPMADVCNAVDAVMEAEGYGEYCGPPWMRLRRRGHGLGFSSSQPGDVGPDNDIVLEPGMVFVLHPNQYLPATGYMMCGEPVVITATGAEALSQSRAKLAEIAA